ELAEYINTPGWNRPAFCNNGDDDDEDCTVAVTPDFPITDSLIIENEQVDTISETESDKFIKSSVENLVPIPSDDDESSHEEVIHEISFKTYSNPLIDLDEEIISIEFNPIHNEDLDSTLENDRFDTDSFLLKSSLNRDTLMISSLKIDSLLAEFAGKLIFLESMPPGVDEANCDPEEDIHLDSESFMEEIDLFLTPDDLVPPGIEKDDDESKRDVLILEEFPSNYSLSFHVNESFHFDILLFSRPPAKPPDGNTGILNIKMMGDISDQKYSRKLEDFCQRILSSKSSFPQLLLGIILLHIAGSQPMLKSSYEAEDDVIISIPPLVGGVADVVVEIKGTGLYYDYRNKYLLEYFDYISVLYGASNT
nr:hypothetical protein [Tanacetum cinerariifolium]